MLQNGQTIFEKNWKVTNLEMENTEATVLSESEDNESKIIDYFIVNEKVSNFEEGDVLTLVVKTQNYTNNTFLINLNNATYDFKYNNEILKNDTLENYPIKKDEERITLKVG